MSYWDDSKAYWDDSKAYWDDTARSSSAGQDYEGYVPDQPSRKSNSRGRGQNSSLPAQAPSGERATSGYAHNLKPGDKIIHDGEEKTVDRVVNRSSGGGLGTSTIYFKGGGKSEGAQERRVVPSEDSIFDLIKKVLR